MKTKTVNEVLREAREYITDPARWTIGRLERADGSCCALGAVARFSGCAGYYPNDPEVDSPLYTEAVGVLGEHSRDAKEKFSSDVKVFRTNDQHGHEAVLEMFDRAIEATS